MDGLPACAVSIPTASRLAAMAVGGEEHADAERRAAAGLVQIEMEDAADRTGHAAQLDHARRQ